MHKKKKILAAGGIMTSMLFGVAPAAQAKILEMPSPLYRTADEDTNDTESEYETGYRPDMAEFGIIADDIVTEIDLELESRQILVDEGFTPAQIYKIFSKADNNKRNSQTDSDE